MKKPNFFIVGFPKCGTTSLARYLDSHPQCFISPLKEPHFFSGNFRPKALVPSWDDYLKLFAAATEEHLAVGEGSTDYILSRKILKDIYDYDNNAKIIALLRNPVDMIHSLHDYRIMKDMEKELDLEVVWNSQKSRNLSHEQQPLNAMDDYPRLGKVGSHVEGLLSVFPREQVKLIVYDDFAKDSKKVYEETVDFLGLPMDGKEDFQRHNVTKTFKYPKIHKICNRIGMNIKPGVARLKNLLGIRRIGILSGVRNWNTVSETKQPLKPEFRNRLAEEFREEVEKLSGILNRDLSHWR